MLGQAKGTKGWEETVPALETVAGDRVRSRGTMRQPQFPFTSVSEALKPGIQRV